MVKIAPSLMCADLLNMEKEIVILEKAGMDIFHLDMMDGHFVPNLSFSFDMIRSIRGITEKPLDVHLMVMNPEDYFRKLADLGVDRVSFHGESANTPIRFIREIKERGMKAGVALNPATTVDTLEYIVDALDFVHLMGVEPGFAGQSFLPATLDKIQRLSALRQKKSLSFEIEIDGGIDWDNGKTCASAGADIIIAGALCVFDGTAGLYDSCTRFRSILN